MEPLCTQFLDPQMLKSHFIDLKEKYLGRINVYCQKTLSVTIVKSKHLPPLGALGSTETRQVAPCSSSNPNSKNSERNPAIFFGSKLIQK